MNSSYVFSSAMGVANGGYFQIDPHANWGHFDFNRTNDFKLFGNYAIPIGRGQQFGSSLPGWANEVIGGLALNANLHWPVAFLTLLPTVSADRIGTTGLAGQICSTLKR